MDLEKVAELSLRSIGTLFAMQGKPGVSAIINSMLEAKDAGVRVDDHMAAIAERLKLGKDLDDWSEIQERLNLAIDDFLSVPDDTVRSNPTDPDRLTDPGVV